MRVDHRSVDVLVPQQFLPELTFWFSGGSEMVATVSAVLTVGFSPRRTHGQFSKRIDRGYPLQARSKAAEFVKDQTQRQPSTNPCAGYRL
jgi:hypothetical protein